MPWWLFVFLMLGFAMLEREVVTIALLVAVPAMLVREFYVFAATQRSRAPDSAADDRHRQKTVLYLRLASWSALAIAVAHYGITRFGWGHKFDNVVTTSLLVAALALTLGARRLQKWHVP